MTIETFIEKKGYTVYKLSKESGISKTTLYDIVSGRSNLFECRVRVVFKIAKTLNCTIEELLKLDPIEYNPAFEKNLPEFLQVDIDFLKDKRHKNCSLMDCYLDETNSSINICEVENIISKEQADYLRKRFLWGDFDD